MATIIHPGFDPGPYRYRPAGSTYLVSVGAMGPEGGIVEAIEIARITRSVLVICSRIETPDETDYFYTVVRPQLDIDIQFVDNLTGADRIDLLAGARAVVHPVRAAEPFPTAIVEAMACGTPALTLAGGAAVELIDDGTTGLVADDVDGLADHVAGIDGLSRGACRRRFERYFGPDEVARHHEDFYRETIARIAANAKTGPDHGYSAPVVDGWTSAFF